MSKNKLTHGEAYVRKRNSARCEQGEVVFDDTPLPKPMKRAEAAIYYNKKLYNYWMGELCDNIPKFMQQKTLNFMLGKEKEKQ